MFAHAHPSRPHLRRMRHQGGSYLRGSRLMSDPAKEFSNPPVDAPGHGWIGTWTMLAALARCDALCSVQRGHVAPVQPALPCWSVPHTVLYCANFIQDHRPSRHSRSARICSIVFRGMYVRVARCMLLMHAQLSDGRSRPAQHHPRQGVCSCLRTHITYLHASTCTLTTA